MGFFEFECPKYCEAHGDACLPLQATASAFKGKAIVLALHQLGPLLTQKGHRQKSYGAILHHDRSALDREARTYDDCEPSGDGVLFFKISSG